MGMNRKPSVMIPIAALRTIYAAALEARWLDAAEALAAQLVTDARSRINTWTNRCAYRQRHVHMQNACAGVKHQQH